MTFWIALAVLALVVVALLVRPLLAGRADAVDRSQYDLAVYRDQLKEIEHDLERGLLTAEQAEAARVEVKRRMLTAAEAGEALAEGSRSGRRSLAVLLAVLLPAGAVLTYLQLGAPGMPDMPHAAREAGRQAVAQDQMAEMLQAMDTLAQRLEENPDDPRGWRILARSYAALGRHDEAVNAYRRLVAIDGGGDAGDWSALGEALVLAADGRIDAEAQEAFERALAQDPQEPRARFYAGEALLQQGQPAEAVAAWRALLADSPADAPWAETVRERMRMVAARNDLPLAEGDGAAPGPSPDQVERLDEETGGMIQAMVARLEQRLEENPDDGPGWARLGRSYLVMGRNEDARAAYSRAVELQPDDVAVRLGYAEALLADVPDGAALPPAFVAQMRSVLELAPNNARALYFVGLAEAQKGNAAEARRHWRKLLGQLPEGSPQYADLQRQIDALGSAGG